jgi:hypothetical protein
MQPIFRGEDIRTDFTVTASAEELDRDFSGSTFRIDLCAPGAVEPTATHVVDVVSAATPGEVTLHLDLGADDTLALASVNHTYKLWCIEGELEQVLDYGTLPVI